jgi:hypothetical protein
MITQLLNFFQSCNFFDAVSSDNLSLFFVIDADVRRTIRRLKPSKSVGLDGIPGFIIKGCIDTFVPLSKYIFNLSLCQQLSPASWKQAAIVRIFKKGNSSLLASYRPVSILNIFAEVFEFVIRDHVSHYVRSMLSCCQHGFIKFRSPTSNLVTYLDYITVTSQRQADAIYADFSSAFDLVSLTFRKT